MEIIVINVLIGLIVIIGFFIYWGKASGVFIEGGIINEWWKNYRTSKKEEHAIKKELKNKEK